MILADTSVWVNHLSRNIAELAKLLICGQVLMHPFVFGEIALGSIRNRSAILDDLIKLPMADLASDEEVLLMINRHKFFGTGLSYVDSHILASALLSGAAIWTADKAQGAAAIALGCSYSPES